jgi:hypothetical protein
MPSRIVPSRRALDSTDTGKSGWCAEQSAIYRRHKLRWNRFHNPVNLRKKCEFNTLSVCDIEPPTGCIASQHPVLILSGVDCVESGATPRFDLCSTTQTRGDAFNVRTTRTNGMHSPDAGRHGAAARRL